MRIITQITLKELKDHFFAPSAYIFIVVFLILSFWIFLSDFFVRGEANLRLFFDWAPIFLLIFIPAVAMGEWADEKKQGTLESLLTLPLRDVEVVTGKFAATFLFLLVVFFFSLPLAAVVGFLGEPDWGLVAAGYLGLALLGAAYLAISLFISSLTPNAIVAFILSFLALFVLYLIGEPIFLSYTPDFLAPLLTLLGLGRHFESIGRGLIDSRDLLYYVTVVGFFLFLNVLSVSSRKRET